MSLVLYHDTKIVWNGEVGNRKHVSPLLYELPILRLHLILWLIILLWLLYCRYYIAASCRMTVRSYGDCELNYVSVFGRPTLSPFVLWSHIVLVYQARSTDHCCSGKLKYSKKTCIIDIWSSRNAKCSALEFDPGCVVWSKGRSY